MRLPVIQLNACQYSDIAKNTPVLNKNQLEYFIWILVDADIMRTCTLYQVEEVLPEGCRPINPAAIVPDLNCWLRATSPLINTEVGQHTYKLLFVEGVSNTAFSLYVSYIIQDDDAKKPYIYMDRPKEDPRCCECTKS